MQIKSILKIGRATISDLKSKYLPQGFFETNTRICLELKSSDPNSEEFANAMDELWLFSRQNVNYARKTVELVKEISQIYSHNPNLSQMVYNFISKRKLVLEDYKKRSEKIRVLREKYYDWKRGEISCGQFVSSAKSLSLSLEGEVQNAN